MKDIPSVGYKTFAIEKGKICDAEISVGANYCDNQFYTVQLGKGGITKLFDKGLVKPTHEKNKNVVCQAVGMDIIGVAIEILKYF